MIETDKYIFFYGGIYSQWTICKFDAPFRDEIISFNSAEQYMMAQKALLFNDLESVDKILKEKRPDVQKQIGRKVKNFDPSTYYEHGVKHVIAGNIFKFTQDKFLLRCILNTGEKIFVEGSPTDCIWGVGLRYDDPKILDSNNWRGHNLLGNALVEVRNHIRKMQKQEIAL